jgi:hypothetical protein
MRDRQPCRGPRFCGADPQFFTPLAAQIPLTPDGRMVQSCFDECPREFYHAHHKPWFPQPTLRSTCRARRWECSILREQTAESCVATFMGSPSEHEDQLRKLSERGVCPNCGDIIKAGARQVYGAGVFCSLGCVAEYNAAELIERHRRSTAAFERHRRS